jgi:hypothetical protein
MGNPMGSGRLSRMMMDVEGRVGKLEGEGVAKLNGGQRRNGRGLCHPHP